MIDWNSIKYFNSSEFNSVEVDCIDPIAVKKYDAARYYTGVPWYPSMADGSVARFEGNKTSRHYAIGRYSDALDFFIDDYTDPRWFIFKLTSLGLFGGIGIYFDTKDNNGIDNLMYHVDCRPISMGYPLVWYRDKGEYTYLINPSNYSTFLDKLNNIHKK